MLNEIVRTTAGKQRHLATPIGPYLKGYLQHRCNQGFAASTLASNLKWVTSFGEYLAEKGHYSLADIGEETLEDFAVHYATYPRRFGPKRVEKVAAYHYKSLYVEASVLYSRFSEIQPSRNHSRLSRQRCITAYWRSIYPSCVFIEDLQN